MKEYKKLFKTSIFFLPIFPQLGFIFLFIYLWLKKEKLFPCIKEDFRNKINVTIVVILGILALISTILTVAPLLQSISYIIYILIFILGFYAIRISNLPIQDILKPYLYAVSIFTIFGIIQWIFHIEIIKQVGPLLLNIYLANGTRITSLAGNTMILSGLSTFAFFIGIMLFLFYKTNIRYLYLILAIAAALAELLTESRGYSLALILGMGLILFIYYKNKQIIFNIIIIALLTATFFLFSQYRPILDTALHNFYKQNTITETNQTTLIDRFQSIEASNGSGRLDLWIATIGLIKERPLFGFGPNSWQLAMKDYISKHNYKETDHLYMLVIRDKVSDAHNTFLRLASDFGFPFALLFISFILYRLMIKYKNTSKDIFNAGIMSSILVIMFMGLIDNPLSGIAGTSTFIILGGILWRYDKESNLDIIV